MPVPMGTMSSGFPQGSQGLTGLPQGIPGMAPAPTGAPQQPPLQSNLSAPPPLSSFPVSFPPGPTANGGPSIQPGSFSSSFPTAPIDVPPQNGTPRSGSGQSSKDGKGGSQPGLDLLGLQQHQQQQYPMQSGPQLSQDLPGYPLGSQLGMSLSVSNPPTSQQQQQLQLQQQLLQMGGGLGVDGGLQQQWGQQQQQQQPQQQLPNLQINPGSVKLEPADTSNPPQLHDSSQAPPAAASTPQLNPQPQQWQLQQNGPALGSGDQQQQQQQQQQMSLLQFHQQQMQLQWLQGAQPGLNPEHSEEAKQGQSQLPPQQQPQQMTPASLAQLQVRPNNPIIYHLQLIICRILCHAELPAMLNSLSTVGQAHS